MLGSLEGASGSGSWAGDCRGSILSVVGFKTGLPIFPCLFWIRNGCCTKLVYLRSPRFPEGLHQCPGESVSEHREEAGRQRVALQARAEIGCKASR